MRHWKQLQLTSIFISTLFVLLWTFNSFRQPLFAALSLEHNSFFYPVFSTSASSSVITLTATGFTPTVLTIYDGTEVTWHNRTAQSHILRGIQNYLLYMPVVMQDSSNLSVDFSSRNAISHKPSVTDNEIFSATLGSGASFSYSFSTTGEFIYFLEEAPQIRGRIIVAPQPSPSPTPTNTPLPPTDIPTATPTATATPTPIIQVNIVRPRSNDVVSDQVPVIALIQSLYELRHVMAKVDNYAVDLVYSSTAYCHSGGCDPGWSNSLSLAGLARGEHSLEVIATDAFSNVQEMQLPILYDRPPTITVQAPFTGTVARPEIHVAATCTDDTPGGCTQVTLSAAVDGSCSDNVITTGQSSIDTTVSLEAYDGKVVHLCFHAYDSVGNYSTVTRSVYVESSALLTEVVSLSGTIWDAHSDRILYLDETSTIPSLKIRQRTSGQDETVLMPPGAEPIYGFLTPKGAIFATSEASFESYLYDWRDLSRIDLGLLNSRYSTKVQGNYAIWNNSTQLFLRDLISGTNTTIATNAGNWKNDVASNGDVVYWTYNKISAFTIFRYRGGITTSLTSDSNHFNTYPLTDGINVVYRQHEQFIIKMYGANGEVNLTSARTQEPLPGPDYQLNNGWIAYTQAGVDGHLQVWIRSPIDERTQVSYFGSSSLIESLNPNGDLMFVNGGNRYLYQNGKMASRISFNLGQSLWLDGTWYVIIGRSLFQVASQ